MHHSVQAPDEQVQFMRVVVARRADLGETESVRQHHIHDEVLQLLNVHVVWARELKIVEAHYSILQDLPELDEVRQRFVNVRLDFGRDVSLALEYCGWLTVTPVNDLHWYLFRLAQKKQATVADDKAASELRENLTQWMLDFVVVKLLLEHLQSYDELAVVIKHEALTGDHLDGFGRNAAIGFLVGCAVLLFGDEVGLQRTHIVAQDHGLGCAHINLVRVKAATLVDREAYIVGVRRVLADLGRFTTDALSVHGHLAVHLMERIVHGAVHYGRLGILQPRLLLHQQFILVSI